MNILALDTAYEAMGICIKKSNGKITSFSGDFGLEHSTRLLPWIDYLLEKCNLASSDLNLIVCSQGPGSFTGLRIGLSTAKGLATGIGCPLVGVSTLEALAYPFSFFKGTVIPVIDAKKKQVFTAFFRQGCRICADLDIAPEHLVEKLQEQDRVLLTGPMAGQIHLQYPAAEVAPFYSLAAPGSLIELGRQKFESEGGGTATLAPVYLRKSEAELKSLS